MHVKVELEFAATKHEVHLAHGCTTSKSAWMSSTRGSLNWPDQCAVVGKSLSGGKQPGVIHDLCAYSISQLSDTLRETLELNHQVS
jgi:hypothetical protein